MQNKMFSDKTFLRWLTARVLRCFLFSMLLYIKVIWRQTELGWNLLFAGIINVCRGNSLFKKSPTSLSHRKFSNCKVRIKYYLPLLSCCTYQIVPRPTQLNSIVIRTSSQLNFFFKMLEMLPWIRKNNPLKSRKTPKIGNTKIYFFVVKLYTSWRHANLFFLN